MERADLKDLVIVSDLSSSINPSGGDLASTKTFTMALPTITPIIPPLRLQASTIRNQPPLPCLSPP